MSTSLFTAEEKGRSDGSSCAPTRMRNGRGQAERQGIWFGIFYPETLCRKNLSWSEVKKLVPVIPSLLFVHASHSQITEFKKRYNFLQFAMWEKSTGAEYITVPDDQMDSFIKIASHYEEDTVYYRPEEIDLKRGMRVCIHGGKFDNVKGMFVRVQGKRNRRVVVLLEGVMAVSAEVHPDLIEVLS